MLVLCSISMSTELVLLGQRPYAEHDLSIRKASGQDSERFVSALRDRHPRGARSPVADRILHRAHQQDLRLRSQHYEAHCCIASCSHPVLEGKHHRHYRLYDHMRLLLVDYMHSLLIRTTAKGETTILLTRRPLSSALRCAHMVALESIRPNVRTLEMLIPAAA